MDNIVRTFPVSFSGIEFCITTAKTLLGKSQTLTCGGGQIACRCIHENPYIGMIETQQDIFKTGSARLPAPEEIQTEKATTSESCDVETPTARREMQRGPAIFFERIHIGAVVYQ
jgi:hypothetical protein